MYGLHVDRSRMYGAGESKPGAGMLSNGCEDTASGKPKYLIHSELRLI